MLNVESPKFRTERDSMGEVKVHKDALYGAQTQRALDNFTISDLRFSRDFLQALGLIKFACAKVNSRLLELDGNIGSAVEAAAMEVAEGYHDEQFVVDIFQTGSGTSTNMNANEVIATLASKDSGIDIHPNDHVNRGQSSNDVIPSCIHLGAAMSVQKKLLPALAHLRNAIDDKAEALEDVVKTGRTHLMDAMPLTMAQELSAWSTQIANAKQRIKDCQPRLHQLAIGGTAVGTGINAHKDLAKGVCTELANITGLPLMPKANYFEALSCHDTIVELSAHLRSFAISLMKISNDLRWMNSGPIAGLGEIALSSLQPGSSIMPGKVNPVIPEAVAMVCAQVMGNDTTISIAGQSGNFQLNVMQPVIAYNILQSIELLTQAALLLADKAIADFEVKHEHIDALLSKNPVLVTALNQEVGYEKGAAIAKQAYKEKRSVIDVALERTDLDEKQLRRLLNPKNMT